MRTFSKARGASRRRARRRRGGAVTWPRMLRAAAARRAAPEAPQGLRDAHVATQGLRDAHVAFWEWYAYQWFVLEGAGAEEDVGARAAALALVYAAYRDALYGRGDSWLMFRRLSGDAAQLAAARAGWASVSLAARRAFLRAFWPRVEPAVRLLLFLLWTPEWAQPLGGGAAEMSRPVLVAEWGLFVCGATDLQPAVFLKEFPRVRARLVRALELALPALQDAGRSLQPPGFVRTHRPRYVASLDKFCALWWNMEGREPATTGGVRAPAERLNTLSADLLVLSLVESVVDGVAADAAAAAGLDARWTRDWRRADEAGGAPAPPEAAELVPPPNRA